jgi:DNA-binding MarR family transcriptional regulator
MSNDNEDMTPAEMLYAGMQMTRLLLRNITSRLETDLEGTGVGVGERAILEVLISVPQATGPEITQILQVKRQLVGRLLKDLIERGLLKTVPNPKHRTSHYYALTKESRELIEGIRATEMARIGEFAACFTPEEIRGYYAVQRKLDAVMTHGYGETDT